MPTKSTGRTVTQKTIADRMGISRQIVGQALSGHPRVSEVTRQRVKDVAAELGYHDRTNQFARELIGRRYGRDFKTGIIAVVIAPVSLLGQPFRNIPYHSMILDGLETEASQLDIDLFLCTIQARGLPRLLRDRGVDGIVNMLGDPAQNAEIHRTGLPMIIPGKSIAGEYCLIPDVANGIRQIMAHLVILGHRRIAYLGRLTENPENDSHFIAFVSTMQEFGLSEGGPMIEAAVRPQDTSIISAAPMQAMLARDEQFRDFGKPGFTAVVCYNDIVAMGAVEALTAAGLRVPEDVSVTGFDNVTADYSFSPVVTSAGFPLREMGRRAIQTISDHPRGEQFSPAQVIFDTHLVTGESTAPVSADMRRRSS